MKEKKYVRLLISVLLILVILSTFTYAEPVKFAKKVYGPLSESMEEAMASMTGGDEFSQRYLHLKENSDLSTNIDNTPIYRVAVEGEKSKYISLTFDSSWIDYYTMPLLDMLDKHNAKATFFLTAFYIRAHSESVKEILRRGHEVGNHSKSHKKFADLKEKTMITEIEDCHKVLKNLTGIDMCLFRFPYGSYNPTAMKLLKERGYYPIQWEVDSLDWKNESAKAIINRLDSVGAYEPGNIILFHNGGDFTVEALGTIFNEIEKRKLECVKVSDLIYENDFYIDSNGHQKKKVKKEDN